jgi:adenylate cyclase
VFDQARAPAGSLVGWRGLLGRQRIRRQDLRLFSGLTLFVYVAAHLLNHALGLISIAAAEAGLLVAVLVWQSWPGTLLLYGAAGVHVSLALLAVFEHRTLRLPPIELLRIVLGLTMPTLLIGHAVSTRLAFEMFGHPPDYAHVVWMLWHTGRQGWQIALLVPGWAHGCLGIRLAFGRRAWYLRLRPLLFAVALLLPTCAVLGFLSMLKEVSMLARDPSWVAMTVAAASDGQSLALANVRDGLLMLYAGLVGAVFSARLVRLFLEERRGSLISVAYPDRSVRVPRGWSVLEASRTHRIPHTSMCGGRGRCSTCRVRVVEGRDGCPPPEDSERRTLARLGVPADVRLACQLRPQGDVRVVPVFNGGAVAAPVPKAIYAEREVTVMMVDLRWRDTRRGLMPNDLLYALGRFGRAVATTARAHGGLPVQSTGDRAVVVFGLEVEAAEGSRQALLAARSLKERLDELGVLLEHELGIGAAHAIYLHAGPAAVGTTGDESTSALTAVGSAVDVVRQMALTNPGSRAPGGRDVGGQIHVSPSVHTTPGHAGDPLLSQEACEPQSERE